MNSRYFRYLMKSFWSIATVYITLFAVFLIIIPFVIDVFCVLLFRGTIGYSAYVVVVGAMCIFLSGLLPLIMHNRYYSKNRSDIILSMPMTRGQAFITELVFGLAVITALLVGCYCVGCCLCLILGNGTSLLGTYGTSMLGLPLLYLACVITFLVSTFAVSVSNSVFQAIVMLLLVNSLPSLVNALILNPDSYSWIAQSSTNWFSQTEVFEHALASLINSGYELSTNSINTFWGSMLALLLQLLFWGGLTVLAFFEFRKLKSEHLGTVIPQRFGVVNTLTLTCMLGFALLTEFFTDLVIMERNWYAWMILIFALAYFLISVIYFVFMFVVRKKAKFRKDDWIRYAIAIGGGIILGMAVFGIVRAVRPEPIYYLALL